MNEKLRNDTYELLISSSRNENFKTRTIVLSFHNGNLSNLSRQFTCTLGLQRANIFRAVSKYRAYCHLFAGWRSNPVVVKICNFTESSRKINHIDDNENRLLKMNFGRKLHVGNRPDIGENPLTKDILQAFYSCSSFAFEMQMEFAGKCFLGWK